MDHQAKVKEFLIQNFLFGEGDIAPDTSLLENRVIDSTGILELVAFLEKTFGVKVEDDEMLPENFDSLSAIGRYLSSKAVKGP